MSDGYLFEGATPGRTAAVPHEYDPDTDPEYRWQNGASFNRGPLVVDGTVYVLTEGEAVDDSYENTIVGYDLRTGRGTCRIEVADSCHCQEMVSDGRLLYLYTERGVTAIDPQAERTRWTREFSDDPVYVSGSLVTADGTVYATSVSENMMGNAIDANIWNMNVTRMATGDGTGGVQRFRELERDGSPSSVAETLLAYRDGLLFFVLENHLYAVDPSSGPEYEWKQPVPGFDAAYRCQFDRHGIAAGDSGVYVAPSKVDAGREQVTGETVIGGDRLQSSVAAYDHHTGTVQWETPLSNSGVREIATAEDVVVAYENAGSLVALDAVDGSRRWEYHDASCRPTIAGGTVFTDDDTTGAVVGLDVATGEETHRYELDEGFGAVCPLPDAVVVAGKDTLACVELGAAGGVTAESEAATDTQRGGGSGETCPDCGEPVASDAQFCSACGADLDDGPACPSCGGSLAGDEAFCPACGTELTSGTQCPTCDAELEGDEAFCPSCGTDVQEL